VGPGAGERQFPALDASGHPLQRWADLIGLAARSHGMSLRVCQAYLDASPRYPRRAVRPLGCAYVQDKTLNAQANSSDFSVKFRTALRRKSSP
jgi:hypothetical protein